MYTTRLDLIPLSGVKVHRAVSRRVRDRVDELERGRDAYAKRAWLEAYEALTVAAASGKASTRRTTSSCSRSCAFMLGRDDESIAWLERAHQRYLAAGDAIGGRRTAPSGSG